ncbi:hypothetical protein NDU88_004056, partial [Pleurodeles waltl]
MGGCLCATSKLLGLVVCAAAGISKYSIGSSHGAEHFLRSAVSPWILAQSGTKLGRIPASPFILAGVS